MPNLCVYYPSIAYLLYSIKVGATYFQNTTSELRNPESISHQGLNSHVSVYFKTKEPNGLILYLGNEKGTSRKMRRSNSVSFLDLKYFCFLYTDQNISFLFATHRCNLEVNPSYEISKLLNKKL